MQESTLIGQTACFHCGENVKETVLNYEGNVFCCEGCRTVFQLLKENNLCTYYSLDEQPGQTMRTGIERKRFDYLKDLDVQHKLVDFKNGSTASVTFFIPNIHCTSCVWLLENLQNIDEGILKGTVNFIKRTVTLIYDESKTELRSIVELLTTIGYEPDLKLEQLKDKKIGTIERGLWLKLGVAGFCFGNIMLFSFPEYLRMDQSGSSEMFRYFFGGLNIILALPVLFFSGIDYLKSAWAALSQRGINLDVPISIGMLALFGRSLFEILSGTGAGYFDSFTGFIFFLLIGKVVQKKTFDQLSFDRDYKSYLPISVIRLEQDQEQSIPVSKIEIGDHVLIRNQELVPADSINMTESIDIDYSFITGESDPVTLNRGEQVFAGGKITGQTAELVIIKKVEHSYLTQLWENESFKAQKEHNLTSFADRISPYFTFTVIGIALISLLIWLRIAPSQAFTIFTAVLIVACPCALALSTPFTLGSAVNILAANGFYLKNTSVLERFSNIDTLVFDKTGTITDSNNAEVEFIGKHLTDTELQMLASAFKNSFHPLSLAVFKSLNQYVLPQKDFFREVPGKGVEASFDGGRVYFGSLGFLKEEIKGLDLSTLEKPERGSVVHIAINNEYKGFFRILHGYRNGLQKLLNNFSVLGTKLYLLSGDNEKEKASLENLFSNWEKLQFNQSPIQKLEYIQNLKKKDKNKIAMIGDGLNDAGALKASDFGVAVSDDKSSFSPACDAIIDASSLENMDQFFGFSKSAFKVIIASFGISLMYNLTGLGFAVTGHLSPLVAAILMPLSSITIMAFTTVATRLTAKRMGLKLWA
ncbi:MAG: heavy metal translocating P-type ATPase metal-binding domain-containing protein [Balneolaceae bacterium]|nr:heavy metal translocating P-type ATPase metal-binding domain-containing protein [Balneolaceae bacterium]MBO6547856.1 heavy metal translocating P-type ATPase metal-binding domain-containing protein [Balneolaceae bacterium]MBO6648369.1 heavy metal translocating P-type ATPase metal-binding domain-containing protein [Balneolaceae bacterium]